VSFLHPRCLLRCTYVAWGSPTTGSHANLLSILRATRLLLAREPLCCATVAHHTHRSLLLPNTLVEGGEARVGPGSLVPTLVGFGEPHRRCPSLPCSDPYIPVVYDQLCLKSELGHGSSFHTQQITTSSSLNAVHGSLRKGSRHGHPGPPSLGPVPPRGRLGGRCAGMACSSCMRTLLLIVVAHTL
jgi:hypothetical protein